MYDIGWSLDINITMNFFEENFDSFKFFGGDMEILFSRCKRAHSRRVFASKETDKKIINCIDLKRGFDSFKNHRQIKEQEKNEAWKNMYI